MRQCVRQTEHSVQRKLPEMVPSKRALTMEGFNNKELICITCWYVIACWEYAAALACRNHLLRNFGQSTDRCCIRIPKFQYTPLQEYIMRDILYRIWLRSRAQSKQHFFQWFIRSRVKMKRIMLSGVLCIKNGRNVFTWWLLFKNRTVVLCADTNARLIVRFSRHSARKQKRAHGILEDALIVLGKGQPWGNCFTWTSLLWPLRGSQTSAGSGLWRGTLSPQIKFIRIRALKSQHTKPLNVKPHNTTVLIGCGTSVVFVHSFYELKYSYSIVQFF